MSVRDTMEEEELAPAPAPSAAAAAAAAAPPEDVNNRAYWICFVLGAGILFPWNAYITAVDYFEMLAGCVNLRIHATRIGST